MNEWLRNLISGYYNYNKPETFDGKPKPHYTDNIDKVEQLKRAVRGYNNYTPPETLVVKDFLIIRMNCLQIIKEKHCLVTITLLLLKIG